MTTDQRNGSKTEKICGQKKEENVHEDAVSFKDPITVAVAQDSGAFDYWKAPSLSQFTDEFWAGGNHAVFAAGGSRDE